MPIHVAVFSRDTQCQVITFAPLDSARLQPIAAGQTVLAATIEIDEAIGEEIIQGIFCTTEHSLTQVQALFDDAKRQPALDCEDIVLAVPKMRNR